MTRHLIHVLVNPFEFLRVEAKARKGTGGREERDGEGGEGGEDRGWACTWYFEQHRNGELERRMI